MFTTAAIALLVLLSSASVVACVGSVEGRAAALQVSSVVATLLLIVLWRALGDDGLLHVALALAVTSVAGNLLFARFLEHWL